MTTHTALLGPNGEPIRLGSSGSPQQLWSRLRRPTTRLIGDQRYVEANPSAALDQQPFVWDCNGFYRRLGLEPGAPRIEVARAYMALDGHRSVALTNAAEVLIDKVSKRAYDRLPLGTLWADDALLPPHHDLADEYEAVNSPDVSWAFYLVHIEDDELPLGHLEIIDVWRWMIAHELWTMRLHRIVRAFGVGFGDVGPSVGWIGFRLVAILPLTLKPSREYASALARLLVESAAERNPVTPPAHTSAIHRST